MTPGPSPGQDGNGQAWLRRDEAVDRGSPAARDPRRRRGAALVWDRPRAPAPRPRPRRRHGRRRVRHGGNPPRSTRMDLVERRIHRRRAALSQRGPPLPGAGSMPGSQDHPALGAGGRNTLETPRLVRRPFFARACAWRCWLNSTRRRHPLLRIILSPIPVGESTICEALRNTHAPSRASGMNAGIRRSRSRARMGVVRGDGPLRPDGAGRACWRSRARVWGAVRAVDGACAEM